MAALIDVVFILLIFFAVSTTLVLNKKGVRLALPEAVSVTENKLGYVVSIDKYNTIFFQDKPILPELLISTVKSLIIEQPEMHIVLNADKDGVSKQVIELLGCDLDELLYISAKDGIGIQSILDSIIQFIPSPNESKTSNTRGLIFDSTFDQYRGVIPYVRIYDGYLEKGMTTKYFAKPGGHEITEVGILKMKLVLYWVLVLYIQLKVEKVRT